MRYCFQFLVLFISIVLILFSCKTKRSISKFVFDTPPTFISYSFDKIDNNIFYNDNYKHGQGIKNKAVSLHGENFITLETNIDLTFPYGTSFWFKGKGNLLSNKVKCTYNRSWALEIEDHVLYLIVGNNKNSQYEYLPISHYLDIDNWNQLYISFVSPDTIELYCNGFLLNTINLKTSLRIPNSTFLLGATPCAKTEGNFDNSYVGSIDEFTVYDNQLGKEKIKKIYYSQAPVNHKLNSKIDSKNEIILRSKKSGILEWEVKSIEKPISHFAVMNNGTVLSRVPFNPYQFKYNFLDLSNQENQTYKIEAIGLDNNLVYTSKEKTINRKKSLNKKHIPRIEGYGTTSYAGNNGLIYKVTNLEDTGLGSLRYGLENVHGPRIIVFEVSGVIILKSHLKILHPFVSVYGQTAPSGGIHITGRGLVIKSHDILIQHHSIRPGDSNTTNINPLDNDAIAILGNEKASINSKHTYNIIIDHCSLSWAIDENISIWYNGVRDVTISNCIISEGLDNSLHPKGRHSKGLLVGPNSKNIAIIKNIFFNNVDRNPFVAGNSDVLILNNLIYACNTPIHIEDTGNHGQINAIIKNNLISHREQTKKKFSKSQIKTNLKENNNILILDDDIPISLIKTNEPVGFSEDFTSYTLTDVQFSEINLVQYLQTNAGANPRERSITDKRILNDIKHGNIPNTINCITCGNKGQSLYDKELGQILKKNRTFELPFNFKGDISNYIYNQNILKEK